VLPSIEYELIAADQVYYLEMRWETVGKVDEKGGGSRASSLLLARFPEVSQTFCCATDMTLSRVVSMPR